MLLLGCTQRKPRVAAQPRRTVTAQRCRTGVSQPVAAQRRRTACSGPTTTDCSGPTSTDRGLYGLSSHADDLGSVRSERLEPGGLLRKRNERGLRAIVRHVRTVLLPVLQSDNSDLVESSLGGETELIDGELAIAAVVLTGEYPFPAVEASAWR